MSTTDEVAAVRDAAWSQSGQRYGTMTRVRRAGFDAGFQAGYEQSASDMEDVEQGELQALLTFEAVR